MTQEERQTSQGANMNQAHPPKRPLTMNDLFTDGALLEKNEEDRTDYQFGAGEAMDWWQDHDETPSLNRMLEKASPAFIRGFTLGWATYTMKAAEPDAATDED
jgi:hypothetical protein